MAFRLWLRKTTCERLLMLQRYHRQAARRSVDREIGLPDASAFVLVQQLLAGGSTPSHRLEHSETARRVREVLAQLSEADREILLDAEPGRAVQPGGGGIPADRARRRQPARWSSPALPAQAAAGQWSCGAQP